MIYINTFHEWNKNKQLGNSKLQYVIFMKNFKIIESKKINDSSNFELIEEGIYNDLKDDGGFATHRIAMAMELEEGEDSQYPLDDILDKYLIHYLHYP